VGERWHAIERVAEALSERGELSGAEIDAIIQAERCDVPSST
jgi:hypothetical protein